jgi:hypothetical protein
MLTKRGESAPFGRLSDGCGQRGEGLIMAVDFCSSTALGVLSLYRIKWRPPIMSIGGVCAARVFEGAGSASEVAALKAPDVPLGRSLVSISIVVRPGGQGTRLKSCRDTRRIVSPRDQRNGRAAAPHEMWQARVWRESVRGRRAKAVGRSGSGLTGVLSFREWLFRDSASAMVLPVLTVAWRDARTGGAGAGRRG